MLVMGLCNNHPLINFIIVMFMINIIMVILLPCAIRPSSTRKFSSSKINAFSFGKSPKFSMKCIFCFPALCPFFALTNPFAARVPSYPGTASTLQSATHELTAPSPRPFCAPVVALLFSLIFCINLQFFLPIFKLIPATRPCAVGGAR